MFHTCRIISSNRHCCYSDMYGWGGGGAGLRAVGHLHRDSFPTLHLHRASSTAPPPAPPSPRPPCGLSIVLQRKAKEVAAAFFTDRNLRVGLCGSEGMGDRCATSVPAAASDCWCAHGEQLSLGRDGQEETEQEEVGGKGQAQRA